MSETLRHAAVRRQGEFKTPDGGRLAYTVEGSGPPLVLCNGLGVSTVFWHHVARAFAGAWTVVTWDYRGHGRSGPAPTEGFGIGTCADDLVALLDHLGLEQAVLAGHSMGSQVILETYRRAPRRVRALVPTLGGYGRTVESFFNTPHSVTVLRFMRRLATLRPSVSQRVLKLVAEAPGAIAAARLLRFVHPELCPPEELRPYLAHLATLDLNVYFQLASDLQDHDASDLLPQVAVPVLVFGADRDLFTPLALSERMASRIPGAELCVIRGGSHAALVEQPELICLRLERFFMDRLGAPAMSRPPALHG
jgi:pimeloyl-ACP methyl ester carboxylesterase